MCCLAFSSAWVPSNYAVSCRKVSGETAAPGIRCTTQMHFLRAVALAEKKMMRPLAIVGAIGYAHCSARANLASIKTPYRPQCLLGPARANRAQSVRNFNYARYRAPVVSRCAILRSAAEKTRAWKPIKNKAAESKGRRGLSEVSRMFSKSAKSSTGGAFLWCFVQGEEGEPNYTVDQSSEMCFKWMVANRWFSGHLAIVGIIGPASTRELDWIGPIFEGLVVWVIFCLWYIEILITIVFMS